MLSDALKFWESIAGKVKQLIRGETQNAFRCERYEVSTAPNGTVMGVKKPFGNEILLPYSQEVSEASVGDPVLVVWWNSMSNAKGGIPCRQASTLVGGRWVNFFEAAIFSKGKANE